MKYRVQIEDRTFEVEIENLNERPIVARVDGVEVLVNPVAPDAPDLPPTRPAADPATRRPQPSSAAAPAAGANSRIVPSPLPGVIVEIGVKAGDTVNVGQTLCVLEAMKMKNAIRAPRAGRIAQVFVQVGQAVKHHDSLVAFED